MNRVEKAIENHKKGYNCAQSVLCAFSDVTDYTEDELFRISEAFGGGMGGSGSVCGAVSAMVLLVGMKESFGTEALPLTNKAESYRISGNVIKEFENKNVSVLCSRLKGEHLRSCDGCIEDAVVILENYLKQN